MACKSRTARAHPTNHRLDPLPGTHTHTCVWLRELANKQRKRLLCVRDRVARPTSPSTPATFRRSMHPATPTPTVHARPSSPFATAAIGLKRLHEVPATFPSPSSRRGRHVAHVGIKHPGPALWSCIVVFSLLLVTGSFFLSLSVTHTCVSWEFSWAIPPPRAGDG